MKKPLKEHKPHKYTSEWYHVRTTWRRYRLTYSVLSGRRFTQNMWLKSLPKIWNRIGWNVIGLRISNAYVQVPGVSCINTLSALLNINII